MSGNYPLFPDMPDAAKEEAQALIDQFKVALRKAADDVFSTMYVDVVSCIESDSWTNFRNKLMDGFRDYGNRKLQGGYDFKEIRQQIYREFRDDIIADLDQDNLARIAELEKQNSEMQERLDWWARR